MIRLVGVMARYREGDNDSPEVPVRLKETRPQAVDAREPDRDNIPSRVGPGRPHSRGPADGWIKPWRNDLPAEKLSGLTAQRVLHRLMVWNVMRVNPSISITALGRNRPFISCILPQPPVRSPLRWLAEYPRR